MAVLENLGTGVQNSATVLAESVSTDLDNYIIESVTDGGKEVDFEDVMDASGARVARLIFNRQKTFSMVLQCKTSATPLTDFPMGDTCALTTLTSYFVDDMSIQLVKGVRKVTVKLTKYLTNA